MILFCVVAEEPIKKKIKILYPPETENMSVINEDESYT